jgi:NitT/TauT family transport system ATP-binding protein
MNDLVLELWYSRKRTILFVTHNIAEAVYLSHRVALLGQGRIARHIDNTLDWPRKQEQRTSLEFARLYGMISAAIAEVSG